MNVKIEEGWKQHLSPEFEKPYFKALTDRVRADYANPAVRVYPPEGRYSPLLTLRRLTLQRW